jgi:Uma2 family endonuclease
MRTVISDPPPAEFQALLERRRRWGADRFDEVWQGVYRMIPAPGAAHRRIDRQLAELLRPLALSAGLVSDGEFNLGEPEDYRIPDRGLYRPEDERDWQQTAALVVEIVSPGDETWEKLAFYAQHDVSELLVIDPQKRTVDWLALKDGQYQPVERSAVIELGPRELHDQLDWPPTKST